MSRDFRNLTVDKKLTTYTLKANDAMMTYDRTDNISSNYSEITNLLTENAQFVNFTAYNASITNLDVVNLTVTNLSITNLTITGTTSANTISSTNLTYTNGVINNALYLPNVNNSVDLSFSNSVNTGIYKTGSNNITLGANGTTNGTFVVTNTSLTINRELLNVDGTEALPSYSFENKTDTGFFRPDDNQVGFTINGDEKMRITNDGLIMDNVNSATRINAVNGSNQSSSFSFNNSQSVGIFIGTNLGEIGFTTSNTQTNMYFNTLSTTVYDPIMRELDTTNISSTLNGGYALAKNVNPIISPYLASNTISNWNYSDYLENTNASLTCVAVSGLLNRYVSLSSNGIGVYSDDGGINFRNCTMSGQTINMKFSSIVLASAPQNKFVAVSNENNISLNDNLAYSIDGITWTAASSSINFRGNRVVYSSQLNIFVAVGNDFSIFNKNIWSNDGINWTVGTGIPVSGSSNITNFRALAYAPELQRFVTIGRNATDNATYIYYSTDGKAWSNTGVTTNVSIIGADFSSVAWSSQLGLFVAIATTGTTRIMYSYDGIIWNNTGIAGYDNSLVGNRILWVDDLGHFVAIYENTNTGIGYSQNGFNWTYNFITGGFPNGTARDIVYSRELGEFVAVFRDPPSAAPLPKNRIVHTEYKFMQPTSKNVFNNALVRVEDNGQYNYKYGIDTSNVGNILDFYNPYGSGQNLFPVGATTNIPKPSQGTTQSYVGGALAKNGLLYCPMFITTGGVICTVINPNTNTIITNITNTINTFGCRGFSLNLTGDLLYLFPGGNGSSLVKIIDTINNSIIGTISLAHDKFSSVVLHPNGKIYCPPLQSDQTTLAVVDTFTNTAESVSCPLVTATAKYFGTALAPNGKIYCAPLSQLQFGGTGNSRFLIINPNIPFTTTGTPTTSNPYLGEIPSGLGVTIVNYRGAVTGADGFVYFIPNTSQFILKINPNDDTVSTIDTGLGSTIPKFHGGVLAQNGNIYMAPQNYSSTGFFRYGILNTDPNSVSYNSFTLGDTGIPSSVNTEAFHGAVLFPDGRIMFTPGNSSSFSNNFVISKTGIPTQPNPWMLGPSFNKF